MSMEKYKSLQKLSASELKKKCQDGSLKNTGTKHEMVLRLCGFEDPNRMSFKAVNEWLENQGVTNIKGVSKCLCAGIQNGFIKINGDDPLNNVVISDECCLCDHKITVTIRDLLYQPDYAGHDFEDGSLDKMADEYEFDSALDLLLMLPIPALQVICRDANMEESGTKLELIKRILGFEKVKQKSRMTMKAVNKWLEDQGVIDVDSVSKCLRAGIQKRSIDISGDNPLDNVVVVDKCYNCLHELKVTIRDLLYQPDSVGVNFRNGGKEATVKCPNEKCKLLGVYVTSICSKRSMEVCDGLFHHHCSLCPGFGKCIGSKCNDTHCRVCGKHYYAGFEGEKQKQCPYCKC
ncbi:uncharacterized protein LOC117125520 [Anneissia japonica]|uniref:uncharacterized protein LOC117125520 n=1 Tax=Anneissia japonica TaxID=1529436 RepID=UPI0014256E8E|nr:uncharacterized protein LOC117125520 [Anneissia japonica]